MRGQVVFLAASKGRFPNSSKGKFNTGGKNIKEIDNISDKILYNGNRLQIININGNNDILYPETGSGKIIKKKITKPHSSTEHVRKNQENNQQDAIIVTSSKNNETIKIENVKEGVNVEDEGEIGKQDKDAFISNIFSLSNLQKSNQKEDLG